MSRAARAVDLPLWIGDVQRALHKALAKTIVALLDLGMCQNRATTSCSRNERRRQFKEGRAIVEMVPGHSVVIVLPIDRTQTCKTILLASLEAT